MLHVATLQLEPLDHRDPHLIGGGCIDVGVFLPPQDADLVDGDGHCLGQLHGLGGIGNREPLGGQHALLQARLRRMQHAQGAIGDVLNGGVVELGQGRFLRRSIRVFLLAAGAPVLRPLDLARLDEPILDTAAAWVAHRLVLAFQSR